LQLIACAFNKGTKIGKTREMERIVVEESAILAIERVKKFNKMRK